MANPIKDPWVISKVAHGLTSVAPVTKDLKRP